MNCSRRLCLRQWEADGVHALPITGLWHMQAECKRELKKLTAELAAREAQLAAARADAADKEAAEANLAAELADSERRLQVGNLN